MSGDTEADRDGLQDADGLPQPRRAWAMAAVILSIVVAVLDGSIANVALPGIGHAFGVTPSETIWIVNAYQLAITVALLPLAALGEIVGFKRVYLAGLAVFTAASLACAFADSLAWLTAARAVQGLGAAGLMGINSALVRYIQPRARLGRAIGLNAVAVASAAAAGPAIGGGILALAGWPWIFLVNVPIGIAALAVGIRTLPRTPRARDRFDWLSSLLTALALGGIILGLDGVAHGGGILAVGPWILLGLLAGVWLVRRQVRAPRPVLPLDLLRIPPFRMAIATSVCTFVAQALAFASLTFLLQSGFGFTPLTAGLLTTPWFATTALAAPLAGRLSDRYPAGLLCGIGLGALAVGLAALALLPSAPHPLDIAWRMALCGGGFGFFNTPNNRAMITAAPRDRAGGASGMLSTARLSGQTFGAVLVALVLARSTGAAVVPGTAAMTTGPTNALWLGAAFATLAAVVSLTRLRDRG